MHRLADREEVREAEGLPAATKDSQWSQIALTGDPRLMVGWRTDQKRLKALKVHLHEDVFEDLRELCQPTVQFLADGAEERAYEQFAALEPGEQFFSYDISDLPRRPPVSPPPPVVMPGSPTDDTADLVRLVRTVDSLTDVSRKQMAKGLYSFYTICWPQPGDGLMVGFVSRKDPMTTLRPGTRYLRFSETLLRKADPPEVSLSPGSDLVVGPRSLAILSTSVFSSLLGDVEVMFTAVPKHVATLRAKLAHTVPLTGQAESALQAEAQRLLSYARRLSALLPRLNAITTTLSAHALRTALSSHGVKASLLLNPSGSFDFNQQNVGLFLDLMEGRYFEDDLTGERRRADRFSRR